MRALVTGATGFIGAHVTRALLDRGWDVHALVLPGEEARLDPRAAAVTGDLLARADAEAVVARVRPEIAVHLAWYAEPKDYLVSAENERLLAASIAFAERLHQAGCRRFVGVGTCLEYDTAGTAPLGESAPTKPDFLYARCKLALHDAVARIFDASFAWARVFWLYGPGERPVRLVPAVAHALLRGEEAGVSAGTQIRDFSHVLDVAAGIAHVAATDALVGPVNVASGVPVTVREVVAEIARIVGREDLVRYGAVPMRAGEPVAVVADVTKLHATGFRPRFDLASGLRDAIAGWRRGQT